MTMHPIELTKDPLERGDSVEFKSVVSSKGARVMYVPFFVVTLSIAFNAPAVLEG